MIKRIISQHPNHFQLFFFVLYFFFCNYKIQAQSTRQRISINQGWRFTLGDPEGTSGLSYDVRPAIQDHNDSKVADSRPTEAIATSAADTVIKKWILPSANEFIAVTSQKHLRPVGNPGSGLTYVKNEFYDQNWAFVNLPHDWAIKGPFFKEENAVIGGGMGRLPLNGIGWYRKKIFIPTADKGKSVFIEIDGAMSYTTVWCNGNLVGGWPYGYNSFRLDLTPYIKTGGMNQIAIRLDNPSHSARWYPGAGIYRNVWLTKINPVRVAHWGSTVSTRNVSRSSANVDIALKIENHSSSVASLIIKTDLFLLGTGTKEFRVQSFPSARLNLKAGEQQTTYASLLVTNPKLWGPLPSQQPNLYKAVSIISVDGVPVDSYETVFGIRSVQFDPLKGLLVNQEKIKIQGVNQHHDLGALGTAFNYRAAERQLEVLREMGCNAIRLSHNPPAPELLDLTDRMGFLVIDEIFDSWELKKTPYDFHLIFKEWYEADTRSFVRRDRNHPSVIAWSYGNEVGEQYTGEAGAVIGRKLNSIIKEEDTTRPTVSSMNYAKPDMPFTEVMDILGLNYQGEGIRDAPEYAHLKGIRTNPLYPAFQKKFPEKFIVISETSSALSTRGSYIFPVTKGYSAPVSDSTGGDPVHHYVSAYELYTAQFGASPDKVFATQDRYPFVAGEFVWSGWDYLGEPTPYYSARSSYCGIIDLAGFKKDRFYLYQSRWRPDMRMVHLLPHWNWPDRIGEITPVHVFTSGDEAELFLNGKSLGKKKKADYEYRLRWDEVQYQPGTLKVIAYKNGQFWAEQTIETTSMPKRMEMLADHLKIKADGDDLSFVTVNVLDEKGRFMPVANNLIRFNIEGPAEIVATDNGDPNDMQPFVSKERQAFFGKALVIIRSIKGKTGQIKLSATADGLQIAELHLLSIK